MFSVFEQAIAAKRKRSPIRGSVPLVGRDAMPGIGRRTPAPSTPAPEAVERRHPASAWPPSVDRLPLRGAEQPSPSPAGSLHDSPEGAHIPRRARAAARPRKHQRRRLQPTRGWQGEQAWARPECGARSRPAMRESRRRTCRPRAVHGSSALPDESGTARTADRWLSELVLSGTRGSDARFAIAKQNSPADAACRWIVSQTTVSGPVSPERHVAVDPGPSGRPGASC
jgi:hypothetical protein